MSSETPDVVSVERVIAAPPEAVFAIISDPRRHREFDGSGTVRDARAVPDALALGTRFGMSMRMVLPYTMVSTVVEYEKDRRLAWQTGPGFPVLGPLVGKVAGGRIWRYELEPVEDGTRVRESWDISQEGALTKPAVRLAAEATRKNMTTTLERLAALVEKPAVS